MALQHQQYKSRPVLSLPVGLFYPFSSPPTPPIFFTALPTNYSPVASSSATTAVTTRKSTSSSLSTGAKAGIGVGIGLAVLAGVIILFFCLHRRRKRNEVNHRLSDEQHFPNHAPTLPPPSFTNHGAELDSTGTTTKTYGAMAALGAGRYRPTHQKMNSTGSESQTSELEANSVPYNYHNDYGNNGQYQNYSNSPPSSPPPAAAAAYVPTNCQNSPPQPAPVTTNPVGPGPLPLYAPVRTPSKRGHAAATTAAEQASDRPSPPPEMLQRLASRSERSNVTRSNPSVVSGGSNYNYQYGDDSGYGSAVGLAAASETINRRPIPPPPRRQGSGQSPPGVVPPRPTVGFANYPTPRAPQSPPAPTPQRPQQRPPPGGPGGFNGHGGQSGLAPPTRPMGPVVDGAGVRSVASNGTFSVDAGYLSNGAGGPLRVLNPDADRDSSPDVGMGRRRMGR
jgi:hypothetical protein